MLRWVWIIAFTGALAIGGGAMAEDAEGLWLTDKGKAKIKIAPCGAMLCSKIVWLREPKGRDGAPVKDHLNPNPGLKNRPVMGLATFSGLKKQSPGKWSGRIYNPEDGKTYTVQLRVVRDGVIHVNGCRSGTMECGQRTWRRVNR